MLAKQLECARDKETEMKREADVCTKQLEALLSVKQALSAEVTTSEASEKFVLFCW